MQSVEVEHRILVLMLPARQSPSQRTVLFIDPSATPSVPGWPLRNFLALLSVRFQVKKIKVICWRDELDEDAVGQRSIIGSIFLPDEEGQNGSRVVKGDGEYCSGRTMPG